VKASVDFEACAERGQKARLLIISNNSPSFNLPSGTSTRHLSNKHQLPEKTSPVKKQKNDKPRPRKKTTSKTTNRKQITAAGSITHNGKEYRINNGKGDEEEYELYVPILRKIIEQHQVALERWRRVFVLRVELHLPHETDSNRVVSLFLKRLKKQLKQKYAFKDIGHAWAREYHGKGKGQHYHLALFLDGNKIRHPSRIIGIIKASWERPFSDYHLGYIKRPFYFVNNEEIEQKAIYRLSYLAKTRGKGHRSPQTKDYQCSRMTN